MTTGRIWLVSLVVGASLTASPPAGAAVFLTVSVPLSYSQKPQAAQDWSAAEEQ